MVVNSVIQTTESTEVTEIGFNRMHRVSVNSVFSVVKKIVIESCSRG